MQRNQRFGPRLHRHAQLIALILALLFTVQLNAQDRKRVAVMNLDVGADAKNRALRAGIQTDLGKDISDAIIFKLVQDGKFTVIERSAIDKVLKEQNFSNSDRADADTAAKIGKIAGADAIIIGSVNSFDVTTQTTRPTTLFGKVIKGSTTYTLTIEAMVRMINTGTGEVVAAVPGRGYTSASPSIMGQAPSAIAMTDAAKRGITLDIVGGLEGTKRADSGGLHNPFSHSSSPPASSNVSQPSSAPASAPAPAPAPASTASHAPIVADVSGNTLILTVGTSGGVKVGDTVDISRPGRVIKDPQTGEVVKVIMTPVGKAKVTEADARSATATFSGAGTPQVNDQVTLPGK